MSGVVARGIVEAAVRRELFGPPDEEAPIGNPVDCSGPSLTFQTKDEINGQFHDRDTLEEVLTRSDPLRRYGVGVLHSGGLRLAVSHPRVTTPPSFRDCQRTKRTPNCRQPRNVAPVDRINLTPTTSTCLTRTDGSHRRWRSRSRSESRWEESSRSG